MNKFKRVGINLVDTISLLCLRLFNRGGFTINGRPAFFNNRYIMESPLKNSVCMITKIYVRAIE